MENKGKEAVTHRLYRKLESRERLRNLLRDAQPMRERPELARLRDYLSQWASYERGYQEKLHIHSSSPFANQPTAVREAGEYLERSDRMAMNVIETAVLGLVLLADGWFMHAAIRARYLEEGVSKTPGEGIRVYRAGKFRSLTSEEGEMFADRGEEALIPMVRKHLPLI